MENQLTNLSLDDGEDGVLNFLGDLPQHEVKRSNLCMIGRFMTEKNINVGAMQKIMANVWQLREGVAITEIKTNLFGFEFFHEIDRDRMVAGVPWSFDNHMLVWDEWPADMAAAEIQLFYAPFWIHVYHLPVGFMSEVAGKQIGNLIGSFIEYDGSNSGKQSQYMRLRVLVDVRKPLDEEGYVHFKYERLATFCYICGLIGHSERFCEKLFKCDLSSITREWGEWLRAPTRKGGGKPSL